MRRLVLSIVLWCAAVRADDPDYLIEQGVQLREQGRDEEALATFQRAYAIAPSPRAQAQTALAEQALGRWIAAERDLAAAMASASDAWVAKHRTALEGALATIRTHLGDLVLTGGAPSAEVRVDGARMGTLPPAGSIRLEIGTHLLEVAADGFYPVSQPVSIVSDAPTRVALEMRARAGQRAPPRAVHAEADTHRGSAQRILGVAMVAAGAVPLVLAFVGIGARESEVSSYNADPACPGREAPAKPPPCQARIDAAAAWEAASILGFIVGPSLAGFGLALILSAPSGASVSVRPGPGSAVATLRW